MARRPRLVGPGLLAFALWSAATLPAQLTIPWLTGNLLTVLNPPTVGGGDTLNISSSADHTFENIHLLNQGTINWQGGYLRSGYNGSLTNAAGALFHDTASSTIDNPYGFGFTFANNGTYHKAAAGTTSLNTTFNNNAQINVTAGSLSLNGGGTNSGSGVISATSGTTVSFTTSYTLADESTLDGAGLFQLTGGTLTVDGDLHATNFKFTGGQLAGNHTLHGSFEWSGGTWNADASTTLAAGTVLTIAGSSDKNFADRNITNDGTVHWQGGYLRSGYNSTFTNTTGGVFHDTASSTIDNPFGFNFAFVNNGTYNKAAAGTTTVNTTFNNNAQINVTAGTLSFSGGGTTSGTGSINAAAGTHVYFTTDYSFASGAVLDGAGTFHHTGGTLTVTGEFDASHLNLSGGLLAGNHTLHGTYHWTGGNWNSDASTTLAAGTVLTISGTTDKNFADRNVTNEGTVHWQGGYLRSGYNSSFVNASGGTFNDTADSTIDNPFGFGFTFLNQGIYNKNGGGTTSANTTFTNQAQINVNAGHLVLGGGGTNLGSGVITAASGTTVTFTTDYTLSSGSILQGAGIFKLQSGTLTVNGDLTASDFKFLGGALAGNQTLHGTYDWSAGSWNGDSATTLASDGVLIISGTGDKNFGDRNITNEGTVNWQGGYLRSGYNSTFLNSGTFNDSASAHIDNPFGFNFGFTNNGTYVKSAGTSVIDVPFVNNNGHVLVSGGTLRFAGNFAQNSGTVELRSGATAQFDGGLAFAAGHLIGSGTVIGNVNNYGLFAPVDFAITGNLTLEGTSGLAFKLGGTTAGVGGYNRLAVTGTVALDGYLSLAFEKGFETTVTAADAFTLLHSSSLTGAFDNVANGGRLATTDGFGSFQVNYAGSLLTLSNFTPVPEPSTYALLGAGLTLLGLSTRRRRD